MLKTIDPQNNKLCTMFNLDGCRIAKFIVSHTHKIKKLY